MPNRIIKEACRTSETLDILSAEAERMFWRLLTVADDFGRFEADARILLSTCFPLKVGSLKVVTVEKWFEELVAAGLIVIYAIESKRFGYFVTWEKHQQKRAKFSKYPEPTPDSICNQLQSASIKREETPAYVSEKRETRNETILTRGENTTSANADSAVVVISTPEELVALYNAEKPAECSVVETISEERRQRYQKQLKQFPEASTWKKAFSEMQASPHLRGLVKSPGHENFIGSLDWLCSKGRDGIENLIKTVEEKYRPRGSPQKPADKFDVLQRMHAQAKEKETNGNANGSDGDFDAFDCEFSRVAEGHK